MKDYINTGPSVPPMAQIYSPQREAIRRNGWQLFCVGESIFTVDFFLLSFVGKSYTDTIYWLTIVKTGSNSTVDNREPRQEKKFVAENKETQQKTESQLKKLKKRVAKT